MTRTLQKIGNSRGLLLSRDMLDHLAVTDTVEVTFEKGKIVLTKPTGAALAAAPRRRRSFEEAKKVTIEQYHDALKELADAE